MSKYLYQRVVQDFQGNIINGAAVTVKITGTNTNAQLYQDEAGTISLTQPVFSNENGQALFYVDAGLYDIEAKKGLQEAPKLIGADIGFSTQAGIDANAAATSANEAANNANVAAENLGYKGEWTPETDVEIGGIYGYQGSEWRSLTGADVEPVDGDDWRILPSSDDIKSAEERAIGTGVSIYRGSNGVYVQDGDVIPVGTTHLTVLISGKLEDMHIFSHSILPAEIQSLPQNTNLKNGYDITTSTGIIEVVTLDVNKRREQGLFSGWAEDTLYDAYDAVVAAITYGDVCFDDYYTVHRPVIMGTKRKLTAKNSGGLKPISSGNFDTFTVDVGAENSTIIDVAFGTVDDRVSSTGSGLVVKADDVAVVRPKINYGLNKVFHGIRFIDCDRFGIHGAKFSTAPDTNDELFTEGGADISIEGSCSNYNVGKNWCTSGNVYGINHTVTNDGVLAVGGNVYYNICKDSTAYGITYYRGSTAINGLFERHMFTGNIVDNITGGAMVDNGGVLEKWFGGGIYLQQALRCEIIGGVVSNVCIQTNAGSLPMGGVCGTSCDVTVTGTTIINSGRESLHFSAGNASAIFPEKTTSKTIISDIVALNCYRGVKIYNGRDVSISKLKIDGVANGSALNVDANGDWLTDLSLEDISLKDGQTGSVINNCNYVEYQKVKTSGMTSTEHSFSNVNYLRAIGNYANGGGSNAFSISSSVLDGEFDHNSSNNSGGYAFVMAGNMTIGDNNKYKNATNGGYLGNFGLIRTLNTTATPSVKNGKRFSMPAGSNITNFVDGIEGQELIIRADGTRTIEHGSGINLSGNANLTLTSGDTVMFVMNVNGTHWDQYSFVDR